MPTTVERVIGSNTLTIETGKLASLAHGAVTVQYGETIILATAVMSDRPRAADMDFLPLTVDFEERLYSAGKIPGSFFRREGRPGQEAILSARLTDRSIRPLFPKGLHNDIQITITVLSADQENPADMLGMVGTSAALSISQLPFDGPIGACRLAYTDGQYSIFPTYQEASDSQLNMVVTSTRDAIIMVEAGSNEVSEEIVLEGIRRAHQANLETIGLIDQLTGLVGKPKEQFQPDNQTAEQLPGQIQDVLQGRLAAMLDDSPDKTTRDIREKQLAAEAAEKLAGEYSQDQIATAFDQVLKEEVRQRILNQGIRPDGRRPTEIRPVSSEVGILPRTHGSGLFNRGKLRSCLRLLWLRWR